MCLTFAFATAGKQYPCPKDVQHSNAVHKAFGTILEEQKPYSPSTSSIDVPDEEKNIPGTLALLKLAKLAQERQWKGSTDLSTNHDAYFLEAVKEMLEAKNDNDDEDDDASANEALEVKRRASE